MTGLRQVCILAILSVWATSLASCDSNDLQNEFLADANKTPSGFAVTSKTGTVISDDPDDWRTAPAFAGKARVQPAYPNPTTPALLTIEVTVSDFNAFAGGIFVRAEDSRGVLLLLGDILDASAPGAYVINVNLAPLGERGLKRLFILDAVGELISYGDVMIE